jgi:glycosyltransferase involved in cell wall biosynthesis
MKKTVVLRAPALSISGYGTHARQVFRWLDSKDIDLTVDLLPWGITSWHVNPDSESGLIGKIMKKTGPPTRHPDVVISLQLPNEWQRYENCFNVGMSAIVETDRCNPEWIADCNKMDRVIVPTDFCRSTLQRSGDLTVDTRVVPESFPDEVLSVSEGLVLDSIETTTNFLLVGQLTGMSPEVDRKNIFYTVKWFCEEFKDRKDVGLIVKSNLGTNCSFHRQQLENIFSQLLREVRKSAFPRVHLINGEMTTSEIVSLYRSKKVSALLTLTRGEGFGLPILEAAACDLPVICTNWSGHIDFMKHGKYVGVDYDLIDIPQSRIDEKIFVKGSKWAQPREEDVKKRMRKFVDSQMTPKQWASDLGSKIRENYSFEAICQAYDRELGDVL